MQESLGDRRKPKSYHLVVLVHGLWGNRTHFDYIRNALELGFQTHKEAQGLDNEELVVYTTHLNEGYKTYDGIDVCGVRVAGEVEGQIAELGSVTKFSICGYSLGGLIARYALGVLYKKQVFKKQDIELVNFTTFCTPHVGVHAPGKNVAVNLFNTVVPLVLGNTGKQMFLKDKAAFAGGLPLVLLMSMENSVFYKALQEFKNTSLYANVINDKRTAWWTAGISRNDPFFEVDDQNGDYRFSYVKGYAPTIVDHSRSIRITRIEDYNEKIEETSKPQENTIVKVDRREYFFINYWVAKLCRWFMVLFNLLLIAPIWVIWFALSGTMETIKSTTRATRFIKGYSHHFISEIYDGVSEEPLPDDIIDASSDTPNEYELQIQQSLNDQTDTFIESLFSAIERKNTLSAVVDETDSPDVTDTEDNEFVVKTTLKELESLSIEEIKIRRLKSVGCDKLPSLEDLHLNLAPQQLKIIESLNKIPWRKFPVYIRDTVSTHACAIVRHKDPHFGEGKIVVRHWITEVFEF
ncbi:LANO_0F14884g1_1 [Lachancea nothofagi CBS 11611]|uniref:LANO_0F14884g1_1 n=1 Tax=Lachancea nothofagi CBS 11611 TaxID=1266666 RepID=A0A1G4KCG6_9SACH|nr:LANO_0F14884g1_1 [Lachancea nothofagi CBS 11611]